jgi:hypothetical protein
MLSAATVSTHCARQEGALNGSAKYWVSCDTFPSRNFIMLTGVDARAFVDSHVLGDPEIALSHDPADRKTRWPARMMTTERLQITPTANYLARLWTVDTRTPRLRGRFDVRELDHPQQTPPNANQSPSECSALPLAASFSVYVLSHRACRHLTRIRLQPAVCFLPFLEASPQRLQIEPPNWAVIACGWRAPC